MASIIFICVIIITIYVLKSYKKLSLISENLGFKEKNLPKKKKVKIVEQEEETTEQEEEEYKS